MPTIAHIVNPVDIAPTSDLYLAQPITFESMRRAKDYAAAAGVKVELLTAQYPEDHAIIPTYFTKTPDLERSILDLGTFQHPRKLPLVVDLLNRLYEHSEADYLIYTNVDIALMPHFYTFVAKTAASGYDTFVINRRVIPADWTSPEELPLMYAALGDPHPGFDCFVFKRTAYPQFNLGHACIGANWIGRVLIANVLLHSTRFKVFTDTHLTFHLGEDGAWWNAKYNDYDQFNRNELEGILAQMNAMEQLQHHPEKQAFFEEKVLKIMTTFEKREWRRPSLARRAINKVRSVLCRMLKCQND